MSDPNLFHLDWERTAEAFTAIIVLSIFIERALALLIENKRFVARFGDRAIKELIAFGASFAVCLYCDFDAFSIVMNREQNCIIGIALTAATVAGGSKGSIKLFHDVMGIKPDGKKGGGGKGADPRAPGAQPAGGGG